MKNYTKTKIKNKNTALYDFFANKKSNDEQADKKLIQEVNDENDEAVVIFMIQLNTR